MHFFRRKPSRGPLQRLNDQRRSLALAGLAVGAVFSAAVLRRRRGGEEVQFEPPEAPAAPVGMSPPTTSPETASPATVLAAKSGTAIVEPEAINAPRSGGAPRAGASVATVGGPAAESAAVEPAAPAPAATIEPATGELSAEEASILAVLAQDGRSDDDRTAIAVATSLERDTGAVTDVLRKLGAEGVVSGDVYTAAGDKIWAVTERGVRRLGAQS